MTPVPAPELQLSVVIPLFNEEDNVRELLRELREELNKLNRTYEVVLVDDGSSDKTGEVLERMAAEDSHLVLLRFQRNFGQTAALSAGIEHAKGEVIVPMDGDLQNDPADIARLLAKLDEGFDCVSGWRKDRQDKAITRRLPSRVANSLISWVGGVPLHDYGCTMKAYRRSVIEGVRLYGEMHRFIPIYSAWQGARVAELACNHRARRFGISKYGLNRIFKVVLDLLVVKFLFSYLAKPIYVFGGFGFISLGLAAISFGAAIVLKLTGVRHFVETPLPLVAVMFTLVGTLSVLIGLLAEVMVRTYYESQGKRPYLIRSVVTSKSAEVPRAVSKI